MELDLMIETMAIYQSRCKYLIEQGCSIQELNNYDNFKDMISEDDFKNIMLEKQRRKNKRNRTKKKFIELYMIRNCIKKDTNIVFGTITLDNKTLKKKEDTYIRKIHEWLKSHFIYAILNKDYGKKNEREHYHFLGLTDENIEDKGVKSKTGKELYELTQKDFKLGFEPTLEIVDENIEKTVNYLLKLNNHSNKSTTRSRIRIVKNSLADYIIFMNGLEMSNGEKWFEHFVKEYVVK